MKNMQNDLDIFKDEENEIPEAEFCAYWDICDSCYDECREFMKMFNEYLEKDKRSMLTESEKEILNKLAEKYYDY